MNRKTDDIIEKRVKHLSAESLARESVNWWKVASATIIVLVGLIVASVAGLYVLVQVNTGDAEEEAHNFLAYLVQGDFPRAYDFSADGFKTEQDEETFVLTVGRLGLTAYDLKSWSDRISYVRARSPIVIRGEMETRDSRRTPFSIQVVNEQDHWKVLSFLDGARAHIGAGAWFRQSPEGEELQALTRRTILDFGTAIKEEDFTEFYNNADFRETRLKQLHVAFGYLNDSDVDFSAVRIIDATYDAPAEFNVVRRSKKGELFYGDILSVSGVYPIEPRPVTFKIRYSYHHPEWKVYRINVEVDGVSRQSG